MAITLAHNNNGLTTRGHLIFLCQLLLASFLVSASPYPEIDELFEKYGNELVVDGLQALAKSGVVTIYVNGEYRQMTAPNSDFVNASTVRMDLNRLHLSVDQLDQSIKSIAEKREKRQRSLRELEERKKILEEKSEALAAESKAKPQPQTQARSTNNYPLPRQKVRKRNPACVDSEQKVSADLKSDLAKRYPGSYSAQLMLLKTSLEAYREICQVESFPESDEVLKRLYSRYYPNYSAIKMLYTSNMEAFYKLRGQ